MQIRCDLMMNRGRRLRHILVSASHQMSLKALRAQASKATCAINFWVAVSELDFKHTESWWSSCNSHMISTMLLRIESLCSSPDSELIPRAASGLEARHSPWGPWAPAPGPVSLWLRRSCSVVFSFLAPAWYHHEYIPSPLLRG